ncbi:MAG: aspartate/glutamate racemase family protein [Sphingobium sp.]|jgi:allantoin racemase|nr:aspartate/glutamate racemase family protein [Sphingobium sp.]MCI1271175.1 aspartate/glutamate racemase family protein [Sphingobium sp.]MCI1754787.1 aspartate/glutamate racemase family protein [Sphingobium sp.]MCI2053039.1 aspartate/glutamate racemase family protein [Sphingobium sp.]
MTSLRIKMIVPVPLPPEALAGFAAQMPPGLVRPGIEVEFTGVRAGTSTLDSYYEASMADAFCLEAGARAEQEGFAAVCINTMSDSGLAALRSRLTIPVTGPGRSSFFLAADLAKRFSVVTMWPQWHWIYEKLALETGLQSRLASIRDIATRPDTRELLAGKEDIVFEALLTACRRCIDEDGADAIVLGSTTMHQSHRFLSDRLEVPVLNPGLVAFKQCEMLLDLGLSHSKRSYHSPENPADGVLSQVPSVF